MRNSCTTLYTMATSTWMPGCTRLTELLNRSLGRTLVPLCERNIWALRPHIFQHLVEIQRKIQTKSPIYCRKPYLLYIIELQKKDSFLRMCTRCKHTADCTSPVTLATVASNDMLTVSNTWKRQIWTVLFQVLLYSNVNLFFCLIYRNIFICLIFENMANMIIHDSVQDKRSRKRIVYSIIAKCRMYDTYRWIHTTDRCLKSWVLVNEGTGGTPKSIFSLPVMRRRVWNEG